ncbi:MAG: hypothetical protein ABJF04_09795 [Reichenbachiella sp.]|uniref:hypothetical protein n=1 Tax=Reichenbachiella sp. TaxID=2184521 RepID=UPI00326517D0
MEIRSDDLKPIAELINLVYSGNALDMKSDLHLIICLLHYVDSGSVTRKEMERAVFILKELGDRLQIIHEQS